MPRAVAGCSKLRKADCVDQPERCEWRSPSGHCYVRPEGSSPTIVDSEAPAPKRTTTSRTSAKSRVAAAEPVVPVVRRPERIVETTRPTTTTRTRRTGEKPLIVLPPLVEKPIEAKKTTTLPPSASVARRSRAPPLPAVAGDAAQRIIEQAAPAPPQPTITATRTKRSVAPRSVAPRTSIRRPIIAAAPPSPPPSEAQLIGEQREAKRKRALAAAVNRGASLESSKAEDPVASLQESTRRLEAALERVSPGAKHEAEQLALDANQEIGTDAATASLLIGNAQAVDSEPLYTWCGDFFRPKEEDASGAILLDDDNNAADAAASEEKTKQRISKAQRIVTAMALLNWYASRGTVQSVYELARQVDQSVLERALSESNGDLTRLELPPSAFAFLVVRTLLEQGYIKESGEGANKVVEIVREAPFARATKTGSQDGDDGDLLNFQKAPLGASAQLYSTKSSDSLGEPLDTLQLATQRAQERCLPDSCQESTFSRARRFMTLETEPEYYSSRCTLASGNYDACDTRLQPPTPAQSGVATTTGASASQDRGDFDFGQLARMMGDTQRAARKVEARYWSWTSANVGLLDANGEYVLSVRNFLRTMCRFLQSLATAPFLSDIRALRATHAPYQRAHYEVRMNYFRTMHTANQVLSARFTGITALGRATFAALRFGASRIVEGFVALSIYLFSGLSTTLIYIALLYAFEYAGLNTTTLTNALAALLGRGSIAALGSVPPILFVPAAATILTYGIWQYGGVVLDQIGLARYLWSAGAREWLGGVVEYVGRSLGFKDYLHRYAGQQSALLRASIEAELRRVAALLERNKGAFNTSWFNTSGKPNWSELPYWAKNPADIANELARLDRLASNIHVQNEAFTETMRDVYELAKNAINPETGEPVLSPAFMDAVKQFNERTNLVAEAFRQRDELGRILYNNSGWMFAAAAIVAATTALLVADGVLATWRRETSEETRALAAKYELDTPPPLLTLLHFDKQRNVWTV